MLWLFDSCVVGVCCVHLWGSGGRGEFKCKENVIYLHVFIDSLCVSWVHRCVCENVMQTEMYLSQCHKTYLVNVCQEISVCLYILYRSNIISTEQSILLCELNDTQSFRFQDVCACLDWAPPGPSGIVFFLIGCSEGNERALWPLQKL